MDLYDPFFQPLMENLKDHYEFIICSEVMEHFYDPAKEISFLSQRLQKGGSLFVMTELWKNQVPFEKWDYQRDSTHVCFYSESTFKWIEKSWAFSRLEIRSPNLIVLTN